ncbi:hypothetical protein HDV03_002103 [Kappamyces sp. JEL0829]|nr:hypothetical protein HDV03_002103 [Kappamyces sp. JEL0829]
MLSPEPVEQATSHIRQTKQLIEALEKENFGLKIKLHLLTSLEGGTQNQDADGLLNQLVAVHEQNKRLQEQFADSQHQNQLLVQDLERLQEIQYETELELETASQKILELEELLQSEQSLPDGADAMLADQAAPDLLADREDGPDGQQGESMALAHLQQEFAEVAQQAAQEILELQDKIQVQQEQLDSYRDMTLKMEHLQVQPLVVDAICQTDELASSLALGHAFQSSFSLSASQSGSGLPGSSSVSVGSQTLIPLVHEISIQTAPWDKSPSLLAAPPGLPPKEPAVGETRPQKTITSEEYQRNKAIYISQLKERNSTLVWVSQHLDAYLGVEHDPSINSFALLKQALKDKVRAIGNLNQEKLSLQAKLYRQSQELAEVQSPAGLYQYQKGGRARELQEELQALQTKLFHERDAAATRVSELIQTKRKLETDLSIALKKLATLRQAPQADGELLQRQYIQAISECQQARKQVENYESRFRYVLVHLQEYQRVPDKPIFLEQAIKALST